MAYNDAAKKLMEEKRKQLNSKKEEYQETESKQKQEQVLKDPKFSMHKLRRLVLTGGQIWYCIPMHSYELSRRICVHTHRNDFNRLTHLLCVEPELVEKHMRDGLSETDAITKASGQCEYCKKFGWQYEPKDLTASIMYVLNTVGEKASFKKEEDGVEKEIVYYLNPTQVVEIQTEGKGGETVLNAFKLFDKNKMFDKTTWGILRKDGEPTKGKDGVVRKIGGGFEPPETLTVEEVTERIGKQGFEPVLPAYAKEWADKIKEVQTKEGIEAAKDEVYRYIITSFDNASEIAEIRGIVLPQKIFKQKESLFS